jgi:hypothetical protein
MPLSLQFLALLKVFDIDILDRVLSLLTLNLLQNHHYRSEIEDLLDLLSIFDAVEGLFYL